MNQSKKISRKVISVLLSLLMVLSCFSGMGLTAFAAPTCPNPGCRSTNVEPLGDTWECQDCGYIFESSSGDDDPAEDGPLVGTVIKVGDTLTLDGNYIEYMPGNSDTKTASYKLERMEYDDPNGWWFIFEESGAFLVAGDETPEPDGFYVSGGNGTQSHPYTLALHYASAEPALDPVSYKAAAYETATNTVTYTDATCDDYTVVAADTTTFEDGKWYIVNSNVTVNGSITVNGAANLILADGYTLTVTQGVAVTDPNSLTIFGQENGTGTLTATGGDDAAGIGGINGKSGPITINGGTINATGYDDGGAGIGASDGNSCGDITINGGTVNASASGSSNIYGIGDAGWSSSGDGTIAIHGGTVNVNPGEYAYGIGYSGNGTINITGGVVNVNKDKAWATGFKGGTLNVSGGEVYAVGSCAVLSSANFTGGTFIAESLSDSNPAIQSSVSIASGLKVLLGSDEANAAEVEPSFVDYYSGDYWNAKPKWIKIYHAPSAYADYLPAATDDATALAAKVVKFDGMDWYLIEDNSTSETEGTVTLFAKECVGASAFGTNNTYSGSTVETYVNNWYTSNISADAKAAVDGNGMFLLTSDQASALSSDVRKCSEVSGAEYNHWWLCTPFSYYQEVMVVDGDYGAVRDGVDDGTNVEDTLGVRPALKLDLSKVEFNSETKTFAVPHIHDGITFTAWTSTNSLPTDGGNYYLTNDVLLENTWYVPNAEVNLCLDGHSIGCAEGMSIQPICVDGEGTTLKLYDKDDNSGTITGALSTAGGVDVRNGGTFHMYGGTVTGNTSTDHGGGVRVRNNATFYLYGGSIENNKTKNQGGYGGGVHVETNSTFNMSGGSIKNNTATGGAGVFIGSNCTFNLSGGSITGNVATGGEGGVLFTSDTNSPATFKLSGNPTVTDNILKFDDDMANFHITSPSNVVLGEEMKIEVVGALTGDGKISISRRLAGVFTNSSNSVKASDYIDKFTTDSRMYRIKTEGDELKIEAPHLVIAGTFVYDDNAADVFGDGKVKFTPASGESSNAKLTLNGYQYDGTEVSEREGIVYFDSIPLDIVLKGENKIKVDNAPGIMINADANTVISSDNGGSLEVVSEQGDAIYANGALTVESGTISATGGNRGIAANGINLSGGKIVATGTGERGYGIYCECPPWLPDNSVSINSGISSLIASGTLGAVYGKVANALEGLGWSDITGTDGQETIAVTAEARDLDYKKVAFVSHTHGFTYSASGATITATCDNADGECTLTDNKATLTIAAPDNLTYDKSAKAAVITDANAIQGTAKVQYQTKSGDAYGEATETAPTNAGTYKASITVGGATASVEYTIAKADPTCTAPTGLTATYGQTLADVTLTNPEGNTAGTWAWADSRTSVGNFGTNTFEASFVPTDTTNYNTKTNIDVSVTVAKKEITVSGIKANNKVYDGTTAATIDTSSATISGALSGDTLTVSADASFSDKNVAEDKTVYLSNITLGGESASNYTLASSGQQETTTASITAKEVTISGITANNKVYDGTTAATINYTSATIQGMVSGDDLSIYTDVASSNFADKNVGNNKTVTISSLLLTGSDAANYTVGSVTVTANITAKEVGLEWSNTELTYNGKAQKPTATATGLAGQDTCTVTVVGEQTNAGNNYTATAQSLSNSNYKLPENKTTAFKINKANQTAPAAPTEAGKTINSITLNEIPNGEYKCGAGDWQTSPTFTGLDQNMGYTFRQRYAADENHNASAGSEEAIIYTANHTHSFTYSSSNGTITATCNGAGTCNLTDNKVSFTLTAPTSLVYDGTDKKATLEGVDAFNAATGLNVSANDIVYNDLTSVVTETKNAGTYQALYTLQTDFPRPFAGITFTVAKADPTCTAPTGLTATYGQTLADVTLTNPSGNTAGTWAWVDGTTSVGDVGTKTFKASFTPADTTNYNTVENVDVTVKVNQANITPTVSIEGWTYGQEANAPSVSGNSGNGAVSYTYATKGSDSFSATVPSNAGNYTVKATVAATTNYNGGTATADFTIAKADITPTVTLDGWTYGEEANLPSVTGNTGNGDVTYLYKEKGASDMSCTDVVPTQAGEYTVKALIAETANYNGGEATADFTIAKVKVTITADDKAIMREAALKELTCKVDGKILDGDDLGIKVTSNVKPAVAGKYEIKVVYAENANYDVTTVDGIYTVTDRITATEKTAGKNKINSAAKASASKKGATVKWGKVANAEKYEIYATYCGKNSKYKKIKTVKGNINSFDITKLGGKKLNTSKCLKVYVVAYRKVNGKYEKITQSVNMHIAGAKNKHTNAKAIKVKKSSYTLKVNKTATIKPTLVLQKKNKKAVDHVAKFRYQSTNKAVATVDKNGKIKAVGKGTCTIYIFANNGKLKSVKVTVK